MSFREAIEDSIPVERDSFENEGYYPPCHICGAPVYSWSYIRGNQYTCKDCRAELVRQVRDEGSITSSEKKQEKLRNAIKRISKVTDISPYEKAIRLVKQKLNKRGWYQSTEEMMVALELIRCGVKAHHQVRIFEYFVDFILPEMRVALEVDGKIYHSRDRQAYQNTRDDAIKYKLGEDWEVIRISTDNINLNITKLIPGITAVLARRQDSK